MITNHDFRYDETLRINFDAPVGVSSYSMTCHPMTYKQLKKFKKEYESSWSIKVLQQYNNLGNQINDIINEALKKYTIEDVEENLDWRDCTELEFHNIDQYEFDDSVIQEIDYKLKELLKNDKTRYRTWYWLIWWWMGYHGLYQINWWWKKVRSPV